MNKKGLFIVAVSGLLLMSLGGVNKLLHYLLEIQ